MNEITTDEKETEYGFTARKWRFSLLGDTRVILTNYREVHRASRRHKWRGDKVWDMYEVRNNTLKASDVLNNNIPWDLAMANFANNMAPDCSHLQKAMREDK